MSPNSLAIPPANFSVRGVPFQINWGDGCGYDPRTRTLTTYSKITPVGESSDHQSIPLHVHGFGFPKGSAYKAPRVIQKQIEKVKSATALLIEGEYYSVRWLVAGRMTMDVRRPCMMFCPSIYIGKDTIIFHMYSKYGDDHENAPCTLEVSKEIAQKYGLEQIRELFERMSRSTDPEAHLKIESTGNGEVRITTCKGGVPEGFLDTMFTPIHPAQEADAASERDFLFSQKVIESK